MKTGIKEGYTKEDMLSSISLKKAKMEAIENDNSNIAWKRLEKATGYEHDPLTAEEQLKVHEESIERHHDYSVPVFILGLESKYSPAIISWFMFEILEIACVVDSIKKRTGKEEAKTLHDVHLWVNDSDFSKILMWEDIFPEIVTRNLPIPKISFGIKDYLVFLPAEFFEKSKKLVGYSLTPNRNKDQTCMDTLIQRYCNEPDTVRAMLA